MSHRQRTALLGMELNRDRLPLIPEALWTAEQREAVKSIIDGPRGAMIGPFVPLLNAPALMNRVQELGAQLRFKGILPDKLRELAILLTAHEWGQSFEWNHHAPLAAHAGVRDDVILAISKGMFPERLEIQEQLVCEVVRQIHTDKGHVSDELFSRASEALGVSGLLELVVIVGYYGTLAMIMNISETPSS